MARQKASLELVNGKGPRQRIWEQIRRYPGPFTMDDIKVDAKVEKGTIQTYVRSLQRAGILSDTEEDIRYGNVKRRRYALVSDEGVEAPRLTRDGQRITQGLAQEQMWRTLRQMRQAFNAQTLAAHASTDKIPVRESAANDYLINLFKAGYLNCTTPATHTHRASYQLKPARNTGPRPPMICRTSAVFDPNENRVVWQRHPHNEEEVIYARL